MEPAQTYAYDANGNPISAAQTGTGSQSATYSNGVDLSSFTAANGTVTTYTYNNQHVVKTASAAGLTSTYDYSTSGNIITSKLTGSGTAYLNSSATVTANKNHAASTTDVNGSTTSYGYHDYLGQTTLVTNANNVQTVYEYEMQTGRPTKTYQSGVASVEYGYANGALSSLTRKSYAGSSPYWQRYSFDTNAWGQTTAIKVSGSSNGSAYTGEKTLATYTYHEDDGTLAGMSYANGDSISYYYDTFDRPVKTVYNDTGRYIEYAYSADGALSSLTYKDANHAVLAVYRYEYDSLGRLVRSSRDITLDISNSPNKDVATPVLNSDYTYDVLGNILTTTETLQLSATTSRTVNVTYIYDEQNQLEAEQYTGAVSDLISYTYDTAGNILTEGHHGIVTKAYTYAYRDTDSGNDAWGDLLVSVDGHAISYDDSGNPLNWYNGKKTFSGLRWEHGRQLARLSVGGTAIHYEYDADGIRTKMSAGSTTYEYITQGGKLMRETATKGSTVYVMDFIYDNAGRPFSVKFSKNGGSSFTTYYYVLNLQGDVVKIIKADGTVMATYTYDAWGNLVSLINASGNDIVNSTAGTAIAFWNPLTYRGYIRDRETGFYYLQSRYYDPANHRFINADSLASTGQGFVGTNMFAYSNNCPVIFFDPCGHSIRPTTVAINDGGSSQMYAGQANCYAYALKWSVDPTTGEVFAQKPQPGEYGGKHFLQTIFDIAELQGGKIIPSQIKAAIILGVEADGAVLGFTIEEVDSADYPTCNGQWLVALGFDYSSPYWKEWDYHWWRRMPNGTWKHKPGSKSVRSVDASGNPITDPGQCDRGRYEAFFGYFVVTPIG